MSFWDNISQAGAGIGSAIGNFAGNAVNPLLGQDQTVTETSTTTTEPSESSNTKTWIIGGIIVIVLIVAGVIIYKVSKKSA